MKRFGALLFALALVFAACGGRASEPASGGEGLAALDETGNSPDAGTNKTDASKPGKKAGSAARKNGGGGKKAPGKQKTSSSSDSGGEESAPSDANSNSSDANKGSPRSTGATAAVPVPGGTHSYDTDGTTTVSGNERRMPKTTTLTARAPRGEEQTLIRDLRDSEGNGTVVETRLLYRKEGVYITYVKITASFPGGFTDVRELQPSKPELIAPTGAKPGLSASFTMEGSGTRADFDIRTKRFENITIGDSTVRALVVDTKIVFSGALEGQQTSTSWFYNKHIMALRENVATDVTNGPIRVQSQYQATLTRLP